MTDGTVIRRIPRADPDVIAGLAAAGVATVHEAGAGRLLPPEVRPIQQGIRLAGSAVTVMCSPSDNLMIHAAVEVIESGDILVVATKSPSTHGMFGELLAVSVRSRGCAGLVIDAAVRDVADLRTMGFPVWARAIHAAGTTKAGLGSVNLGIAFEGITVEPGDVVVADDDGVAIVERERAREVLTAARQRLENEEVTRRRLASGELGLDIYGFRQRLQDLGSRWLEYPE
ncbi:MAG TPA: 4-carboxy-4-hydroxy-2-oxoadipate aldolase/oxaloacetate decarboxylase [Acidimicrobiia bacterium]|nr:4-carboxy-4-hydroxy-2-oxoadipate aldolase/oxaloacetate decarboxylase [Acidimicrobiia bacterium]